MSVITPTLFALVPLSLVYFSAFYFVIRATFWTVPDRPLLFLQHIINIYLAIPIVLPLSNSVLREAIIKSKVELTHRSQTDGVGTADWSPDGKWIATGSRDETAKVWGAKTGQELLTLIGHDQAVASVV